MNAMEPFYEIWDIESGNCLGTFDTEDEGLAIVSILLEANGLEFANALVFGLDDPKDEAGEALVKRVHAWRSQRLAAASLPS